MAGASRSWLVGSLALALALRLLFAFVYWADKPLTLDEQEYLLLARSVASGQGFGYPVVADEKPGMVHFERPPVYPAVIAATLAITGHPWASPADPSVPVPLPLSSAEIPRVVVIVQSVLGVVGVWLLGVIAGRAAGPKAARVAWMVAAVHPALVWSCAFALSELLYSTLAMAVTVALMSADRADADAAAARPGTTAARWMPSLMAGLAAGVAVLTKEGMLFFLVLGGGWLLWRRQWRTLAALSIGTIVVLAPWVGRNYAAHGRFVLTAAHGGVTFWTGNNPLADGEGDLAANPTMKAARNALEADHPGASAQEMDAIYYDEALGFIRQRPGAWVWLECKKAFYSVVPIGPSYLLHSTLYRLGSWIPYAVLVPLALWGVGRLGRRARVIWPIGLMAASVMVMNLMFFPQERFRIPIVDPALIVCAATLAGLKVEGTAGDASRS
jgi:hypothetical protein